MIRAIAACLLVVLAPPRPAQPIPRNPERLAQALSQTTLSLHADVDRWRAAGGRGHAPEAVELTALYQQRIYRLLARDERLAAAVLPRLPRDLRPEARADVAAGRDLFRLAPPPATRHYRVGPPLPAATLRRYYRDA